MSVMPMNIEYRDGVKINIQEQSQIMLIFSETIDWVRVVRVLEIRINVMKENKVKENNNKSVKL